MSFHGCHTLHAALVAGEISWERAEVICSATDRRNLEAMAAEPQDFLDWIPEHRFDPWARRVRRRAEELDADGGYDPNDDVHAERLRFCDRSDATVEVVGRLVGVTVRQVIDQLVDELFRRTGPTTSSILRSRCPTGPPCGLPLDMGRRVDLATPSPPIAVAAGSSRPQRDACVCMIMR